MSSPENPPIPPSAEKSEGIENKEEEIIDYQELADRPEPFPIKEDKELMKEHAKDLEKVLMRLEAHKKGIDGLVLDELESNEEKESKESWEEFAEKEREKNREKHEKEKHPLEHEDGHHKHEKEHAHGDHGHGKKMGPKEWAQFGAVVLGGGIVFEGGILGGSILLANALHLTPVVTNALAGIGLGASFPLVGFGSFVGLNFLFAILAPIIWDELKKVKIGGFSIPSGGGGGAKKGGGGGGGHH